MVSIIALLVSILLPALMQAKEQARITVCASNLHTIGTSLWIYASDNEGNLPLNQNGAWLWDIAYYTTDVVIRAGGDPDTFYCPCDGHKSADQLIYWNFYQAYFNIGVPSNLTINTPSSACQEPDDPALRKSYYRVTGYFWLLDKQNPTSWEEQYRKINDPPNPPRDFLRKTTVRFPSAMEMVVDATLSIQPNPDSVFTEIPGGMLGVVQLYDRTNHLRDGKPTGGNITFVDGHVELRHFDDMIVRYPHAHYNWW
ncbi:MAG: hypothetical protein JW709_13295 [Sedimentisphaerales bacterium]|nr:hypothetical protein [Sedimentisphaerales bacterium]